MTVTPERRDHIEEYMRNPLLPGFIQQIFWKPVVYDRCNGVYLGCGLYGSKEEALDTVGAFDAVSATFKYDLPVVENRY